MSDANLPPPPPGAPLPPLPPRSPDEETPKPGLARPLALLFAPAAVCAVLAHFLSSGPNAVVPVLGVALVGGLICGIRCGYLLAARWVRDPDRRTGIAILLGLACSGASVVASFVGCVAGVSTK